MINWFKETGQEWPKMLAYTAETTSASPYSIVIKSVDPAVKPKTIWQQIYSAFISEERQAMRKALRNWCVKGGCVMAEAVDGKFPMIEWNSAGGSR